MSDENITQDTYASLGMTRNPDGSITRFQTESQNAAVETYTTHSSMVITKDIPINRSKNTWARIILPREAPDSSPPTSKLPLIIYFHGGGFVLCSVDTPSFQGFYASMAVQIPAIVVSVEYRRAPEDRLPAAYDDCMESLHWIKASKDEWLTNYADFSRTYLMGTSAGGNVAYHVGLGAADCSADLEPLIIKGWILHHPFFGGVTRTKSEMRSRDDQILSLSVNDLLWELSLPMGADRDHEYSNPTVGMKSNVIEKIKDLGWKILVTGCEGDPLIERQIEIKENLLEMGVEVVGKFDEGGQHGIELMDFPRATLFFKAVKELMDSS